MPLAIVLSAILLLTPVLGYSQAPQTLKSYPVIHNKIVGKSPGIFIQLIRQIGDIDTTDENVAFNNPTDIVVDGLGSVYVLDSANNRIQKFGKSGGYLGTFGRKGQGPGEFSNPDSFDIGPNGELYVLDSEQSRIQEITPEGAGLRTIRLKDGYLSKLRYLKSGLFAVKTGLLYSSFSDNSVVPRIIKLIDQQGRAKKSFVDGVDFGEPVTSLRGNSFDYAVGRNDSIGIAYDFQNRIDKYASDGRLLWTADRPLGYAMGVLKKGRIDMASSTVIQPEMNRCSAGVAIDGEDRLWVVTLNRQLRREERILKSAISGRGGLSGASTVSLKTEGNRDLRTTNAYKLEIFDPNGVLLGEIPLTHFVDAIRISGDSLFLLDQNRAVTFYMYKILQ